MKTFFPVSEEQVNDEKFKSLTPAEKLYYWTLCSEFNFYTTIKENFVRSDAWFAAALSLSVIKIRQARRKFEKEGWIKVKKGHKLGERKVATTYLAVKWSKPLTTQNRRFSQMHRHALFMLLESISKRQVSIKDAVVYVYLNFFRSMIGKIDEYGDYVSPEDFFITKGQLFKLSQITKAIEAINNLYYKFIFEHGAHLFEYKDKYTKISFNAWAQFDDPAENENARKKALLWEEDINFRAKLLAQ